MHQTSSAPSAGAARLDSTPPSFRQAALVRHSDTFSHLQDDLDAVVYEACRVAAEGTRAWFATVLRYSAEAEVFVLQARIGYPSQMLGRTRVAASLVTTAGPARPTGQPVDFRHLDGAHRIQVPEAMQGRGIRRTVSVPIQGEGHALFGVLEVGSPDAGEFAQHDLCFLRALARSTAAAVDWHSDLMLWAGHAAEALEHGRGPTLGGWQQDAQIGTR